MIRQIHRPVFRLRACRIRTKKITAFPIARRPDGARHEATAAIWTHVTQQRVDTRSTECALITANARLQ